MPQAVSINAFAHFSEFALVSKIEIAIDDLTVSGVAAYEISDNCEGSKIEKA